jgi:NAD-dependent SIR2 family protein deacetylase
MDDSVQVKCTKCKTAFRERARRLQNGYSRQCPCCEVVMFFDEDAFDANIKRAMRTARRLRKDLREVEAAALVSGSSSPPPSRRYGGRHAAHGREETE